MPDYPSRYGSAGAPWVHPPGHPSQSNQSSGMTDYNRSHALQPDYYISIHKPSIVAPPPHISAKGRTDSSGSSGDKLYGGSSPLNQNHGYPVFRSPPVGYGVYPYGDQFHPGGPPPVQPMPVYSHYPLPYPHQPWSSAPPPSYAPIEYITELGPEDVLSGRGGATNSYKGNRAFRTLVKKYQPQYLKAKKRDKPGVAAIIVDLIRKKGGRFLRRCDNKHNAYGNVLWVDIGDDRAREKTCQALREGAPELRRKTFGRVACRSYSYDEDESAHNNSPLGRRFKDNDSTLNSPSSTIAHTASNVSKDAGARWSTEENETDEEHDVVLQVTSNDKMGRKYDDGPIRVRPWARLLPDRGPVKPIDLDQLSVEDREMYLRDFLPPDPTTCSTKFWEPQSPATSQHSFCYDDIPAGKAQLYGDHFSSPGSADSGAMNHDRQSGSVLGCQGSSSPWALVDA